MTCFIYKDIIIFEYSITVMNIIYNILRNK